MTTNNLPAVPAAMSDEDKAATLDLLAELLRDIPAPKRTGLKPGSRASYERARANLLADMREVPSPVNPAFTWRATEITIGLHYVTCRACGLGHQIPNAPLVRWERPHKQQVVTCERFPKDWESLPRRVVILTTTEVASCHVCGQLAIPTATYESPLTDLPTTEDATLPHDIIDIMENEE